MADEPPTTLPPPSQEDDQPLIRLPDVEWADALYDVKFPPLKYVVDQMIVAGTLFMVAGRPKAGKSWLLLNLVRALSEGQPFLGCATDRMNAPVAYMPLEDGKRRVWERMHCMAWRPRQNTVGLIFDRIDLSSNRGSELSLLHHRYGFSVFIIDTLRAALGDADENDNSLMGAILTELASRCHELGITVIVSHHTRKGATVEDSFDALRGASATRGSYDGGAIMHRAKNETVATLLLESRDLDMRDLTIRWEGTRAGWQLAGYADEIQASQIERQILDSVADGAKSLYEIRDIVGVAMNGLHATLKQMVAGGKIVTFKDGGAKGRARTLYGLPPQK